MIIHVDMDAFFASVEQLDHPGWAGQPVIVGGASSRGVVSASSYEARKYGVYSAMPMYQARQKCPRGIFVPPRKQRYQEVSRRVMAILAYFTPVIEPVSIDEAFMDITGCESLFGPPQQIGRKIKDDIRKGVGLTCSVGIAPVKFLAKIASDMDKPDGLVWIPPEEMEPFIATLPVGKISGVGQKAAARLEEIGIAHLGDIKKLSRQFLVARLGKYGHRLHDLAHGIDQSQVVVQRPVKSVSSEETLARDISDKVPLQRYLLKHSEEVGRQLRQRGRRARTVILKVKHADFQQKTRQTKLPRPTCSSKKIYQAASALLASYSMSKPVRLIGLGASDLEEPGRAAQLDLFSELDNGFEKWEKVDRALDGIAEKFGRNAVTKAGLAEEE
ncbi:MAG: DNA polymerase IV [Desulfosudaceae bacterium]